LTGKKDQEGVLQIQTIRSLSFGLGKEGGNVKGRGLVKNKRVRKNFQTIRFVKLMRQGGDKETYKKLGWNTSGGG